MKRERQTRRLTRRISRIKRRLAVLDDVDELGLRGPLKRWVERVQQHPDIDLDEDGDGKVDFEELVDAVVECADAAIEVDSPLIELISDVGLEIVGEIAVLIYRRTEHRLNRRVERLERRLRRLQGPSVAAA